MRAVVLILSGRTIVPPVIARIDRAIRAHSIGFGDARIKTRHDEHNNVSPES